MLSPSLYQTSGPEPRSLGGELRFGQVAPGYSFVCAVGTDHTAWCWGYGGSTALGNDLGTSLVPSQVATNERFIQIAAPPDGTSAPHVCGVTLNGKVICWGANRHGETSGPDDTDRLGWRDQLPREVPLPVPAMQVAVGGHQSCALDRGGAAWCWGDGMDGALGVPDPPDACGTVTYSDRRLTIACARIPVRVVTDQRFTTLAMGRFHSCGLTARGEIWCWGSGRTGTLPEGAAARLSVPRRSPRPSNNHARYTSLSAGEERTCATTNDGEVVCWRYFTPTLGDIEFANWTTGFFLKQVAIFLLFTFLGERWFRRRGRHEGARAMGMVVGLLAVGGALVLEVWIALSSIR